MKKNNITFKSNVTVNWKGKFGKRGLSELAYTTLEKVGHTRAAEDLKNRYERACKNIKKDKYFNFKGEETIRYNPFDFKKELEVVKRYVIIKE